MKYIDEFRQRDLAESLAHSIRAAVDPNREYRFMEFCGGHTHAIFRYGIQDLMPANVQYIHGPGCPVCVLPAQRLDLALDLVRQRDVILCSYGDLLRVPSSNRQSLLQAKALGADIRMVYSSRDALQIARENPAREVVFFAIGFETTTPPTAVALLQARREQLKNFSVYCNHLLTPAAVTALLDNNPRGRAGGAALDGLLGPSHVSSVIGSKPYAFIPERYGKPVVIAGFEPLDVMQATWMLIQQMEAGRCQVENQYTRVVSEQGNLKAQALVNEVFSQRDQFAWRGLGTIAGSALQLREAFYPFDTERRFALSSVDTDERTDNKACECPAILRGEKKPTDCRLFDRVCTPENPMGSCMVSSEGACAAYYSYGRFRTPSTRSEDQVA